MHAQYGWLQFDLYSRKLYKILIFFVSSKFKDDPDIYMYANIAAVSANNFLRIAAHTLTV